MFFRAGRLVDRMSSSSLDSRPRIMQFIASLEQQLAVRITTRSRKSSKKKALSRLFSWTAATDSPWLGAGGTPLAGSLRRFKPVVIKVHMSTAARSPLVHYGLPPRNGSGSSLVMGCSAVGGGKGIGPAGKHQPSRHVVRCCEPFGRNCSTRTHKVVGGHPVRLFGEERKQLVGSNLHTGSERVLGR